MIHLFITTCVMAGNREHIYLHRISNAFNEFKKVCPNLQCTIINNCGEDMADYLFLLEDENIRLFHTKNNFHPTTNKGWKELKDIQDCIHFFNIPDDDFIIKLTGRYLVLHDSPFLNALVSKWNPNTECIIRYGDEHDKDIKKINIGDDIDCQSGLIGFKCHHFKSLPLPLEYQCLEWILAEKSIHISSDKLIVIPDIGVNIF